MIRIASRTGVISVASGAAVDDSVLHDEHDVLDR